MFVPAIKHELSICNQGTSVFLSLLLFICGLTLRRHKLIFTQDSKAVISVAKGKELMDTFIISCDI